MKKLERYEHIVMVVENEKIFNILKIFRSKVDTDPDSQVFLSLIYNANNQEDLLMLNELSHWQKSCDLRVVLGVINKPNDKNWDGYLGLFSEEMLDNGLPLPNGQEIIIISVDDSNIKKIHDRISKRGFDNFIIL